MNVFFSLALTIGFYGILLGANKNKSNDLKLWYNKPAEHFEESLVLGNGRIGASVFGGVKSDKIFLNEATLWAGEPVDPYMNPEAYKYIPKIREALNNEDYKLADELIKNVQGKYSESFAPLGTMFLDFDHKNDPTDYYRNLNLDNAISTVQYAVADTEYKREYFISYPDQVMVINLSANAKKALNFSVRFESLLKFENYAEDNTFRIKGYAPYHAEPSYRGDMPNAVQFDPTRGMRFGNIFKVLSKDGEVVYGKNGIQVKNASQATILVSIATSFNGYDKNPATEGADYLKKALDYLSSAENKSLKSIRKEHIQDYASLFNRVSLKLGAEIHSHKPTGERLKAYSNGNEDLDLEALYFQFGRYLLIAGSRTPAAPLNLQGIWNPYIRPPWSSNYTVNINVETNYWMAENTNLTELSQPLFSWIKNVAKTGEVTAKTFFGVNGWTACHNSDIWAMSNPVGDFGEGHPSWANWFMGGAWLGTHLTEHYAFTQDKAFLKTYYPIIKGASLFCLEWLTEGKNGNLMTSPGTSPENRFFTPEGYKGATLYGSMADLAMTREILEQTIKICEILDVDTDFKNAMKNALDKLQPYKIGKKGNLQEWFHDWEDVDKEHRHQTHLYGLFPGHHITAQDERLAKACAKSLELRGDDGMGWSYGWRICLWARLQNGDAAYKVLKNLLNYMKPTGPDRHGEKRGGTYPNLFSAAPPLQIDGNFSGGAGIAEMLLQSTDNEIKILPAIPEEWKTGSFTGLCARGGFEVSTTWEGGKAVKTTIKSKTGEKTKVVYGEQSVDIELKKGKKKVIKW